MGVPAHQVTFNTPPLTFTRDEALNYTGLAPKMFDRLEEAGSITGRKIGRNGAAVYLREQLEKATANLFGGPSTDIDSEFEGLGG